MAKKKAPTLQVETTAELLAAYRLACLSQGTDMTRETNSHMLEYVRKHAPAGPVREAALRLRKAK